MCAKCERIALFEFVVAFANGCLCGSPTLLNQNLELFVIVFFEGVVLIYCFGLGCWGMNYYIDWNSTSIFANLLVLRLSVR